MGWKAEAPLWTNLVLWKRSLLRAEHRTELEPLVSSHINWEAAWRGELFNRCYSAWIFQPHQKLRGRYHLSPSDRFSCDKALPTDFKCCPTTETLWRDRRRGQDQSNEFSLGRSTQRVENLATRGMWHGLDDSAIKEEGSTWRQRGSWYRAYSGLWKHNLEQPWGIQNPEDPPHLPLFGWFHKRARFVIASIWHFVKYHKFKLLTVSTESPDGGSKKKKRKASGEEEEKEKGKEEKEQSGPPFMLHQVANIKGCKMYHPFPEGTGM